MTVDFDNLRDRSVGTVNFVSANNIEVKLNTDAPENTAVNTGVPSSFPRINGFVLIPNEIGALVGIIKSVGIEHTDYPRREGLKDFDIIDLPYPTRKMSVNPLGTLKRYDKNKYKLKRGVHTFPSVGDKAIIPSNRQLKAIIESKEKNAQVVIGRAALADNANVRVNPNKIFGRHLAVLGNTGSGKSCSVAGLIRWSLETAKNNLASDEAKPNARFIVLDPNGEYKKTFDGLDISVTNYSVKLSDDEVSEVEQLQLPAWMWNSYEWSSFASAKWGTQRPILRSALRDLRMVGVEGQNDSSNRVKGILSTCMATLERDRRVGPEAFMEKPGKNEFGEKLKRYAQVCEDYQEMVPSDLQDDLDELKSELNDIIQRKTDSFTNDDGNTIKYFKSFDFKDVDDAIEVMKKFLEKLGGIKEYTGPDENTPIPFEEEALPTQIERLAKNANVWQYVEYLVMRIRNILADKKMGRVIGSDSVTLDDWLTKKFNGIAVIDLSLIPSEIIHIVVSVISRIIFEAIQRHRKLFEKELPTTLVLEEAHTFVSRYRGKNDNDTTPANICCETFEKIAREGRKFGLGLVLSSQRPSELSPTVLSQCNSFLLHRIVNKRDQELVRSLVPDHISGMLSELPVLPTRQAILLGWASPIPILTNILELDENNQPQSSDPKFWEVWTGEENRKENWKKVADDWQGRSKNLSDETSKSTEKKESSNEEE